MCMRLFFRAGSEDSCFWAISPFAEGRRHSRKHWIDGIDALNIHVYLYIYIHPSIYVCVFIFFLELHVYLIVQKIMCK